MERLEGLRGWAREIEVVRHTPDHEATLAQWYIHLDTHREHPFWYDYVLSVIHLRAIEGVPKAIKHYERATHELVLLALDSNEMPDPDKPRSIVPLTPPNIEVQFQLGKDEQAMELAKLVTQAMIDNVLPAEVAWGKERERWFYSIARTAEHLREGGHPKRRRKK